MKIVIEDGEFMDFTAKLNRTEPINVAIDSTKENFEAKINRAVSFKAKSGVNETKKVYIGKEITNHFKQEQVDLSQKDESQVDFIKNKSTKYLLNEGCDGRSPYATEDFVKTNGGKIDTISIDGEPQTINDKNVDIPLQPLIDRIDDVESIAKDAITNDELDNKHFATEEYVRLNGGKIDSIKVNGEVQSIVDKVVDIAVPKKVVDLEDGKDYVLYKTVLQLLPTIEDEV